MVEHGGVVMSAVGWGLGASRGAPSACAPACGNRGIPGGVAVGRPSLGLCRTLAQTSLPPFVYS